MNKAFVPFLLILASVVLSTPSIAQDTLYSSAVGDPKAPAVLFLHGGPGYNSASFEITTAKRLADSGFFVVAFDQRGCGRSSKVKGKYTLDEAVTDVQQIYDRYHISKATLVGHSWGGTLGALFLDAHPEQVSKLVLVSSPLSYQRSFRNIAARAEKKARASNDTSLLDIVNAVRNVDTASLPYATTNFQIAMGNGAYTVKQPTEEAKQISATMKASKEASWLRSMTMPPTIGYFKSLHYTTIDLTDRIRKSPVPVYGIYGDEDGLYDEAQLQDIEKLTGPAKFHLIKGAAHNVFLDQQTEFVNTLIGYCRMN